MAVPLFVLNNERNRIYKRRTTLECLSNYEIKKHTGLEFWAARELVNYLEPKLEPRSKTNHAIPAETRALQCLGFFRSGSFQWLMGTVSGTSQASQSRVLERCVNALVQDASNHIYLPHNLDYLNQQKQAFYAKSGIPNVIGVVDGTHIFIQAPFADEHVFVGRKQRHSINCQIVSSVDTRIQDLVVKWPGSTHDSFIWRNSSIRSRLASGYYGDSTFIGDSGYAKERFLLTPIRNPINEPQRTFNNAFRKVRSCIERTIGVWKSRYRCLHVSGGELCYQPQKASKIIMSTAVLHNFCYASSIPLSEEDEDFYRNVVLPEIQADYDDDELD